MHLLSIPSLDSALFGFLSSLGFLVLLVMDQVTGPLETRHVQNDNAQWEQETGAWLDKAKPRFKDDFLANFYVPHSADIRETVILRVVARLERLRSVMAGVI